MSRFSVSRETTLRARRLRHEATPYERLLWSKLKNGQMEGLRFRRQHPVGPYILDFYCPELKLCVELDGHSHGLDGAEARDARRTDYLEARGITVVRFWNDDVKSDLLSVVDSVLRECRAIAARKNGSTAGA